MARAKRFLINLIKPSHYDDDGYVIHGSAGENRPNIEIIQREMPLDLIEFFFLTPLPGSEDHKVLHAKDVWMDPDLNKYDLNHRVSHHPIMSDAAWEKVYFDSWRQFYTPEHVETVLRRDAARGARTSALYSS